MPELIWGSILVMIKLYVIHLLHDPAMALVITIASTRRLVVMLRPFL
jgi:hypothetical protein